MKDYAAALERETAARLLKQALSAEADYSEKDHARISRDRFARLNRDALSTCQRGILDRPAAGARRSSGTDTADHQSLIEIKAWIEGVERDLDAMARSLRKMGIDVTRR